MEKGKTHPILIAAGAAVLLFSLLGAAALTGVLPSANTAPGAGGKSIAQAAKCASCGTIESIRAVEVKGESSGVGAVAGAVTGGLLGNQVGSGSTRTVLTVGGAAGGAFAGDAVEKHLKKHVAWRVQVRLDNGTLRTLSMKAQPPFAVGDRVRVTEGAGLERA
jgi:outer membrane lipoprotein SlyB